MSIYLIVLIAMCVILLLGIIISLLTCCELAFYIFVSMFKASLAVLLIALFLMIVMEIAFGGCSWETKSRDTKVS